MDWSIIFAIGLFGLFAALMCMLDRREARQRREAGEALARRPSRPVAEIAPLGDYGVAPEVAQRVLQILADVSEFSLSPPKVVIEPSRLREDDTLHNELGYEFDSLAFCELHLRLEKEFGIKLALNDLSAPPTVGDIVRIVGEHVDREPGSKVRHWAKHSREQTP